MWKFISRGFRETFERGINLSRADVKLKKDAQNKPACCWNICPVRTFLVKQSNCIVNKAKGTSGGANQEQGGRQRTDPYTCHNWIGAVSYGGAVALGWVLSQPYHHLRKWWEVRERKKVYSIQSGSLVHLLTRIAVAQPFEIVYTKETPPIGFSTEDDTSHQSTSFGPVTAEQALEEAAEELWSVHNAVLGEVQNRRGVDCVGRREHSEAVALFKAASKLGYAPAAYNLAQCYELGLGLNQDFTEAAKWYKLAADTGHATAMYNLGVFYAHGWGGLKASSQKARQLFKEAARLGQPEAMAALGMNESQPTSVPNVQNEDVEFSGKTDDNEFGNDPNKLFNMASSYENSIQDKSTDPYLILQMYQMASEMGHSEAKSRLHVLRAYDAIGLLSEFLLQRKTAVG